MKAELFHGAASRVAPYRVASSGKGLAHVMTRTNRLNFDAFGADNRNGAPPCADMQPLLAYDRLLAALRRDDRIDCVTLAELIRQPSAPGRIRLAIRHDVDSDIVAALDQAKIEQAHGIRTSYYILHTAPYYGFLEDGIFRRHDCMAEVYRRIAAMGHEIGLHTDPLAIYQDWCLDGGAAVTKELAWLRASGLDIRGTVAHNSVGVYGAANYAVFKGRPQELRLNSCPKEVVQNGKWAPLQVLDEKELGLEYEGNDIFWQATAPVRYAVAWNDARWWWEAEKSVPRLYAQPPAERESPRLLDADEFVAVLSDTEPGSCAVLVVHPEHFGLRHSRLSGPAMRLSRSETACNSRLGWFTYAPGSLLARHGAIGEQGEFQTMTIVDGSGMLDRPGPPSTATATTPSLRVAWFGGTNSDGSSVHVALHASERLRQTAMPCGEHPVAVWKYAFPGMGLTRLFGWYRAVLDQLRPDIVILAIGADELQRSLQANWRRTTGVDPAHPVGLFLDVENGVVVERPASTAAPLYFRPLQPLEDQRSLANPDLADTPALRQDLDHLSVALGYFIDHIRAAGAEPLLLIEECGESAGIWSNDDTVGRRQVWHTTFRRRLDAFLAGRTVAIADPYPAFLDSSAPPHWQSCPEWNTTGHRLAAQVLTQTLAGVAGRSEGVTVGIRNHGGPDVMAH